MLQTGRPADRRAASASSSSSRGASTRTRSPRAAILERAGLEPLTERRVETLSGGEAQRLRFAMAIAGDPDLVFLDEPTVAMDVETRRAFWADMRASAGEGRTILFATHYLEEADQVADRIVVLDRGRIVADGTAAQLEGRGRGRGRSGSTCRGPAPTARRLGALPGVTDVDVPATIVRLTTADADATVRALVRCGRAVPRPRGHGRRPRGRLRRPHHARPPPPAA